MGVMGTVCADMGGVISCYNVYNTVLYPIYKKLCLYTWLWLLAVGCWGISTALPVLELA
jgi:hypothetical protein